LVVAGIALWRRSPAGPERERYTIRGLTFDAAANVSPVISPDGKLIAYASDRGGEAQSEIWLQQVAGGEPVRLTNGLGLAHDPVFSPDGSRIAFRAGVESTTIYIISALGGAPRRIADCRWPHWAPDGTQLSCINPANSRIMIVSASGGAPREVPMKRGVSGRALWLPDGKFFLYASRTAGAETTGLEWYTVGVDGGEESATGAAAAFKAAGLDAVRPESLVLDGVLAFAGGFDSANICRIPFDFASRRVTGALVPITVAPGVNFWPTGSADGRRIVFASAQRFNSNLWQMPLDAASGVAAGEPRRITDGLQERIAPFPMRDGTHIVYVAGMGSSVEIRLRNLTTAAETRIAEAAEASPPVISDDSSQVAWAVMEQKRISIYSAPLRGGVPRRLCTNCGRPVEWFANGTRLLYDRAGPDRNEIHVLDIATGQSRKLLGYPKHELFTPRLSPDGRLLCFTAVMGTVERRIYLAPFSPDHEIDQSQWTVFLEGSNLQRQPFWSANGQIIYFLSERDAFRCVWGQRINRETRKPIGDAFAVRHFHQFRNNLLDFGDVANIGLSVAGNTMFIAIREIQSNIWLAERQSPGETKPKQP
ncbi:MAG TPA: hypothetical protein VFL57_18780, partial [Bryobacteraceae bacterium]|nr:hypothetical protein [Bryobacteraceae bacterium]